MDEKILCHLHTDLFILLFLSFSLVANSMTCFQGQYLQSESINVRKEFFVLKIDNIAY